MTNALIVNYHDACIYQSDLNLLQGNQWLNDACINFGMTHLSVRCNEETNKKKNNACDDMDEQDTSDSQHQQHVKMEFLDPSVVSFFMHQISLGDEEDIDELRNLYSIWGLSAEKKKQAAATEQTSGENAVALFVPVNDNNGSGFGVAASNCFDGNHWSFLLAVISTANGSQRFFHFDSSAGYNHLTAIKVSNRIRDIVIMGSIEHTSNVDIGADTDANADADVIECRSPQQNNGYDCGLHALVTAEAISEYSKAVEFMIGNNTIALKTSMEEAVEHFVAKFASDSDIGRKKRRQLAESITAIAHPAETSIHKNTVGKL
mmetsp:Transcript_5303/g.8123  ORF Transcript_5303/g.8123 Transcript_5303/m.8123 type:complete len:319 (-) Transcript_5303:65-1021(-)